MKNELEGNQNQEKPVAGFVISLLAGLWMLVSSAVGGMGWHGGMGHGRMMEGMGRGSMWMWRHDYMNDFMVAGTWSWIGLVVAILVCVAAIMVYVRPHGQMAWGTTIIVGSVIAAITGVGFLPAVLGVVGGILAVSWRYFEGGCG